MAVSIFFVFNFSFTGLSGVLKSKTDYGNVCHNLLACIPKTGTREMRNSSCGEMCVMADIKSCSPILCDYNLRAVTKFIVAAEMTLFLLIILLLHFFVCTNSEAHSLC